MNLLALNSTYQLTTFGEVTPDQLFFVTDTFTGDEKTGLPTSAYNYFAVLQDWKVINQYGLNPLDRPKLKIRKCYWTGKPRTRMNIIP